MEHLTIPVDVSLDIAVRCSRSADWAGIILISRNHNWLRVYLVQ